MLIYWFHQDESVFWSPSNLYFNFNPQFLASFFIPYPGSLILKNVLLNDGIVRFGQNVLKLSLKFLWNLYIN